MTQVTWQFDAIGKETGSMMNLQLPLRQLRNFIWTTNTSCDRPEILDLPLWEMTTGNITFEDKFEIQVKEVWCASFGITS